MGNNARNLIRATVCLLLLCFYFPFPILAQSTMEKHLHLNDTLNKVPKKRFGRAALLLGLAEIGPWSFDRYISNRDWARISFKTVGHNLKPSSWTWDNDKFLTNQFAHPFHGTLYYNSFRTSGYNFWQSASATFAGSYIWETFSENQAPSPNDFINTGFGGAVLGEMTYRLANRLVNNRSRGFKRQATEVIALLINPINGVSRILDGKWGKRNHNLATLDTSKVSAEFNLGLSKFKSPPPTPANNNNFRAFGRIKILFGNRYENYKTPFSNMFINIEFGQDDSSKVNIISAYGALAGWKFRSNEKTKHLAVLSANYDYIHKETFFYGAQSVKMNLFSEYNLNPKLKLTTSIGAGPIILAAIPDQYLFGRNYSYTSGISLIGGAGLKIFDKLFTNIDYQGGWLTMIDGTPSYYFLNILNNEVRYVLLKRFSLSAETGFFSLHGHYKTHQKLTQKYPYFRISTRYSIKL